MLYLINLLNRQLLFHLRKTFIADYAETNLQSINKAKHPSVNNLTSFINRIQGRHRKYSFKSDFHINKSNSLIYKNYFKYLIDKNKNFMVIKRSYCACPPESSNPGRHKYNEDVENAVNKQILAELNAGYAYLSMACYFGRSDIALPGCFGFFMLMYEEEQEHALIFINYQNKRGGKVKLCPLSTPEIQDWRGIDYALAAAIKMEKSVKEKLIYLHDVAEKHHDLSVMDLVTNYFIEEQERSICELARLLVRVNKMGPSGVAEYLFDKEIHKTFVKKSGKNFDPQATGDKSKLYI